MDCTWGIIAMPHHSIIPSFQYSILPLQLFVAYVVWVTHLRDRIMEHAVVLVALCSSYGLGMCFSLLGSLSVKLMPRLKIDEGQFGTLISCFMFTCLVASLIVGVSIDKLGYKPIAIFGFAGSVVPIAMLALSPSYTMTKLACILLGFGAMALNVAANTLLPMVLFGGENPARASNLGNVAFGLGLFLTPLLVSLFLRKLSYEKTVLVLAALICAPVILAIIATYPESDASFQISQVATLITNPVVLLGAFILFCYISLEISFSNWLPSFGKDVLGQSDTQLDAGGVDAAAQRLLSYFAIAMMAGRFLASQFAGITQYGSYVIAGAAVAAGVIILVMTRTKSFGLARILAVLSGLAFAPCFPTTVGVTFAPFEPAVYGTVFGLIFAIGLLGAVIIPKAIGNLAKGSSVQKGLRLLLPSCVLLLILALVRGLM